LDLRDRYAQRLSLVLTDVHGWHSSACLSLWDRLSCCDVGGTPRADLGSCCPRPIFTIFLGRSRPVSDTEISVWDNICRTPRTDGRSDEVMPFSHTDAARRTDRFRGAIHRRIVDVQVGDGPDAARGERGEQHAAFPDA